MNAVSNADFFGYTSQDRAALPVSAAETIAMSRGGTLNVQLLKAQVTNPITYHGGLVLER